MAQGALGAAGVRRVWAGAGLQRAAYRAGHRPIARLPVQLVFNVRLIEFIVAEHTSFDGKMLYSDDTAQAALLFAASVYNTIA